MSDEDFLIWKSYYPGQRKKWVRIWADVELGEGRPHIGVTDPTIIEDWKRITRKRADIIAETPDAVLMIELRANAQGNAVGRLLSYRMLWNDDPLINKPLSLVLVTDVADEDIRRLASLNDITYVVVPTPTLTLAQLLA